MKDIELWECGVDGTRIPYPKDKVYILPSCPFCGNWLDKLDESTTKLIWKILGRLILFSMRKLRNKDLEEWK